MKVILFLIYIFLNVLIADESVSTKIEKKNNNKSQKLLDELTTMKIEFQLYKRQKKQELNKINKQLRLTNQKLIQKNIKIASKKKKRVQKSKKKIAKNQKKSRPKISRQKIIELPSKSFSKEIIIHKIIKKMPLTPTVVPNSPWVEITVEDNINIYELALKYYGDAEEYTKIYMANHNIIPHNYQLYNGMLLKIPITETFEEQPMILNTD